MPLLLLITLPCHADYGYIAADACRLHAAALFDVASRRAVMRNDMQPLLSATCYVAAIAATKDAVY